MNAIIVTGILFSASAYYSPSPFGTSPGYVSLVNIVFEYCALIYFIAVNSKIKNIPALFWVLLFYYSINFIVFPLASGLDSYSSIDASIKGLLYFLFALCAHNSRESSYQLIKLIAVILAVAQLLRIIGGISLHHLINFGAAGSYTALFCLVAFYLTKEKQIIISTFFLTSVWVANSISSIASFFISLSVISVITSPFRSMILGSFFIMIIVYAFFKSDFDINDFRFANKSFEVILTGSGRFQIYDHCVHWLLNDFRYFGLGLFNENEVFKQGHPLGEAGPKTCHSSPLSAITSYGAIGILILLVIYILMFAHIFKYRHSRVSVAILALVIFSLFASFFSRIRKLYHNGNISLHEVKL